MGAEGETGDKKLQCCDCKGEFVWSAKDQAFYEEKQFVPPKRCAPCRKVRKQARESQGR